MKNRRAGGSATRPQNGRERSVSLRREHGVGKRKAGRRGREPSRVESASAIRRMRFRGGGSLARAAAQETPVGDLLVSR